MVVSNVMERYERGRRASLRSVGVGVGVEWEEEREVEESEWEVKESSEREKRVELISTGGRSGSGGCGRGKGKEKFNWRAAKLAKLEVHFFPPLSLSPATFLTINVLPP